MPQNSYELPSVYTSLEKQKDPISPTQHHNTRPLTYQPSLEAQDTHQLLSPTTNIQQGNYPYSTQEGEITQQRRQSDDSGSLVVYRDQTEQDRWLAWLLLGTSFSMLFFTVVPVVANLPYVVPSWFSGDSLWRLFDPLFTLPLNLFIMTRANVICTGGKPNYWGVFSEQSVAWLFWALGAGIFVQGHGLHTAAAMFKHPVQDFNLAHPDVVTQYPILNEIYSYMRDLWEHIIAHYMYAFGGMVMSWAQLFAFRNQVHGPLTRGTKVVFMVGSLIYGLLLAGIAIEFPDGLYVGLVYSLVIGLICVLLIVLKRNGLKAYGGLFTLGRRMVLQFYLGSCVVGLVIVIIWIAIYGFKNRLAAGVAT